MNFTRVSTQGKRCLSTSVHSLGLVSPRPVQVQAKHDIVLVDGVRTPFLLSWTGYNDMMAHDLQRIALNGLMNKIGLSKKEVDYICVGNVLQDPHTPNPAKEAAIGADFPHTVPAHTVSMACISALQAVATGIGLIQSGCFQTCIGGGVEFISDPNIRLSRPLRSILTRVHLSKTISEKAKALTKFRPTHMYPDIPSLSEFSTDETMGHFCDRLSASFKVSREEQDSFAVRSHELAAKAQEKGFMSDVIAVKIPKQDKFATKDNGIRKTSMEKLSSLNPSFVKPHGTVTAGNSSFLTDGASACLICTEERALQLGLKPKAYIRNFTFTSESCKDHMLLGPVHSIPKVIHDSGLKMEDIGVWEIHEAFSGQLLACLKALDSDYFMEGHTRFGKKFGQVPIDKLNLWGGSLSLGHPFGATGTRLIMHAANRLIEEDQEIACVSACAAGGHGSAMILERHPMSAN